MIDFQNVITTIHQSLKDEVNRGLVASYIPELADVDATNFGIHLRLINGDTFATGDWDKKLSIQSISKVLTLAMVLPMYPANLWQRVDVEPSGNPFNHLSLLELENGIPRNPLINAGALVIADILVSLLENPKEDFLNYVRTVVNDPTINFNETVANSERLTGYNNYAAANLLKAFGNLKNDVDDVLDFYFHQCAIEMTCEQLTKAFFMFANHGACCQQNKLISESQAKRINAIMLTCGFYDEAGEFAFEVGLPGKSGVGGGIVALLPNHFTISVWSPGLNEQGNSLLGMKALEQFTSMTKLSIF
ncbi:glutaminase [Gelidibacter salicanalis]|uniref:Glutaminase n=1 Tax=Gelidibacter salicanalis TaxID=291193 RepID=A0A934KN83_9FLAO|nr:glutaminase [Gelidibacter salicanalis]MBJ7880389.1 glutaminase [Gelidibacter salicanalis]